MTGPGEPPDWLADRVEAAVTSLLSDRRAEVPTARFTAGFELAREPRPGSNPHAWEVRYHCDGPARTGGSTSLSTPSLPEDLRRTVTRVIADEVEP